MSSIFAGLARWAIPPQDHTSTAWGRQDCPVWCQRAVRGAWLHHHAIPHSTEGSTTLDSGPCSTSEKILPFLTPDHQANSAGLIQPPAFWLSKDAPILNGSNWVLVTLCFLISGNCVTRAWQVTSASTETFGNSAISYLKSEYKNYTQAQFPNCDS